MNRDSYELLAYIARYWFAFLGLLVAFRAWKAAIRDNRKEQVLRAWEGGQGCVGELVVVSGGSRRRGREGRFLVPQEAVLGSGSKADIQLHGRGIRKKHIFMTYRPGEMTLHPIRKATYTSPRDEDGIDVLRDGDKLQVGKYTLMMVFFDVADARPSDRKSVKPKQILPEDYSEDEFEDVWEENPGSGQRARKRTTKA